MIPEQLETLDFPWSLERAAQQGLGAACWHMDRGEILWLERSLDGFQALSSREGELRIKAVWTWSTGENSALRLALVEGPWAAALEQSGLSPEGKSGRLLEVFGALALGKGRSESLSWEHWQRVKAQACGDSSLANLGGLIGAEPWKLLMAAKASLVEPPDSRVKRGGFHV
jgi:hypothetical protein